MKISRNIKLVFSGLALSSIFLSSSSIDLFGQNSNKKTKPKIEVKNGISVPGQSPLLKNTGPTPLPFAVCNDLGVENGWSAYTAADGFHQFGGSPIPLFFGATAPAAPRFNLTNGAGVDPCTQGTLGPTIPVVCPGFGASSIQLGQPNTSGLNGGCTSAGLYPAPGIGAAGNGCSEMLTYPLTVGPQDTNFIYAYAIVVENPPSGHTAGEAPFAEIYILEANGDTVPCSHRKYIADLAGGVGPGFYLASCAGSVNPGYPPAGMIVSYKPWTMEGVNLSAYVGLNLTVVIKNSDCALGGHYCYSYWDFSCGSFTTIPASYCVGNSVTIAAPIDPTIAYTYQWFQNGSPYTGAPSNTSQTIIPYPQPGDTFAVLVSQPSGCPFYVTYVPIPMVVTPDFNYAAVGSCGSGLVSFTDSSYTPNGAPMVSWNWSFPGGTPATSSVQNPTNIAYAPGTYTATLIVTSQQGCIDTISLPLIVTAGIPPVALATTAPVCFNNPSVFSDLSTGNPTVSTWAWDFGDGNTSAVQNPSHTYATAGTFTITLIITNTASCKDTFTLTTTINPLPVVNFNSAAVCLGDSTCFTDASTVAPGSIVAWSWNFGDPTSGAANTSANQNPCHMFSGPGTFTVLLTVTSDSGCQSTKAFPATINPPPVAGINPQSVCLNAITNFTDGSVPAAGDPLNIWDWNFGDGTAHAAMQNPTHTYVTAGTYTVTLIITSLNGCKDTTDRIVTVYNPPVANFSKPDSGCAPICVNYLDLSTSVDGNVASWQWSLPGAVTPFSSVQNPQNVCYNLPGNYSVALLVTTSFGCKDSITLPMIHVFPWPKAEFCVAPSIAPATSPEFNFCDLWSNDVVQWSWDFGDNTNIDSVNTDPMHSYSATATANDFYTYNVCLRVENQNGCWDTTCHPVELVPEFTFYIPNTFTPNSDHMNEYFFGKGRGIKEYNIWLFDRWGNQLWDCHREDKNTLWDGPGQDGLASFCKWDGVVVSGGLDMGGNSRQLAQEDVYVWKVQLTDIFERRHTYVGHVNVVR